MVRLEVCNSEVDIARYKEDQRSAPHICPVCHMKKMMTIAEIEDHSSKCLTGKRKR